ncbi:putative glucan 1,3-beta-glucosidase [Calycina marina]|uniref:glucan 1,3-beta-glucosidase n=1 Tax=Calycina marina TaxID=1763456 RepID=A0A9P8CI92_9HELO|nr:putative glucan 1,3-beta-glucosidase [Calycina marina]
MTPGVFSGAFNGAKDQYTFDSIDGAADALEKHWSSYFTEADIQEIAKTGINALRIPIGYWAYNNSGTPYQKGAEEYMDKAIQWARKADMKVWVDCHGSPGSQNGFDNSGQAGDVNWQMGWNMAHSIDVLKIMAKKYGAKKYADVVVGLELTNEPISWGANDNTKTMNWAKDAYHAVKKVAENKDMVIVMHDAFMGGQKWTDTAKSVMTDGVKDFGVDTHMYQLFVGADNKLTQQEHIQKACGWSTQLKKANDVMPIFVGEWSAATNICVKSDGSTVGGTSCSDDGCQCQSASMDSWNNKMKEQVQRFVEAQLDTFEANASGYFIWSAKGPGGWGFMNGIKAGVIPNPLTTRKFPGQCSGGDSLYSKSRRSAGGFMIGV